jgi:hypothetical protein
MSAGLAFGALGALVILGLIGTYVGEKLGRRSRPIREQLDVQVDEASRQAHLSTAEIEDLAEAMRRTGVFANINDIMEAFKQSVEAARSRRESEGESAATSGKGEPEQRQTGNQPG